MNKIIMCLVFISCTSLFSMDSTVTLKLLDDDGNVQVEKQMRTHVLKRLKSKSNTINEMFGDIPVSEVSIPTSEISVKTWDEIESLWTLWDSKQNPNESLVAVSQQLSRKRLDEIVYILNGLEYLHELNKLSVSSIAIPVLGSRILNEPNKGHEPVLQQLKPRISRLVIDYMLSQYEECEIYDLNDRYKFPPSYSFKKVQFKFTAPEYVTIPQAVVLWKIMSGCKLQSFKIDDKTVNEKKIYQTLDEHTRYKMEDNFMFDHGCCTIL